MKNDARQIVSISMRLVTLILIDFKFLTYIFVTLSKLIRSFSINYKFDLYKSLIINVDLLINIDNKCLLQEIISRNF